MGERLAAAGGGAHADVMRCLGWMVVGGIVCACGPVVADDGGADGGSDSGGASSTATTGLDSSATGTGTTVASSTTSTSISTSGDPDGSTGEVPQGEISGRFLLAFSAVIDPTHPLQWEVQVKDSGAGAARTLELVLQPLSLDVGSTTTPRQPVGTPTPVVVEVGDDGAFTVPLPGLQVPGEANPITGGDLGVSLVLAAGIRSPDLWCGEGMGTVTQPLMLDLAGSTFAAARVDDGAPLPDAFPTSCPQ